MQFEVALRHLSKLSGIPLNVRVFAVEEMLISKQILETPEF